MHFSAEPGGNGRRMIMLALAGFVALSLGACSWFSDEDEGANTTTPFTQALSKDYSDLASQASALPAAANTESFWQSLNPFSSSESSSDALAKQFSAKADLAQTGAEPEPEAAPNAQAQGIHDQLVAAVAAGKDQFPEQAARAQADYDCWVIYGTVPSAAAASQACKTSLDSSLVRLTSLVHPAPAPAPPPPPVASAPIAPPSAAPAPTPANNVFTVYFDWDSWTLKAEQLKVLTDVINTARAGGQSNIVIVGHTDTSGPADYNMKLSVRRANVVVEALVDMGARRAALHASGVGETDLAVQTGDNVREAKNRRTVITLNP